MSGEPQRSMTMVAAQSFANDGIRTSPSRKGLPLSDTGTSIVEVKTVIRCRDYEASRAFYREVLGFGIAEEWREPGDVGCVFSPLTGSSSGYIEIYGMTEDDPRYDRAFSQSLTNDKIDIQLRTPNLQSWVDRLQGRWPFSEPETTPWGHRWIKLRDPDNLLIAIYEVIGGQQIERKEQR